MTAFSLHPTRWLALIACFAIFYIVFSGNVRYTQGDSRYSLLATTAILETGTMRLDQYAQELRLKELNHGKDWMLYRNPNNNHLYYDYPVGTPIFSIPFVALARMGGMDMLVIWEDNDLQILIAGFLLASIFLLIFRISRYFVEDWAALIFSLLLIFGTSLMSTLGTALWSQNFQTLFITAILLELVESVKGKRLAPRPYWLGFLLFAAWLCRPTAMFFDAFVVGIVFWKFRSSFVKVSLTLGAFLSVFALWSILEMGTIFPRYYLPGTWEAYGHPFQNLQPILIGPARGLFSFTPVLLLGFIGFAFKSLRRHPLYLLVMVSFIFHTWMILQSKNPWGGWCYGPRFYAELVPVFGLALLMTAEAIQNSKIYLQKAWGVIFVLFSAFGIYVHTAQGIYNGATMSWNGVPHIDDAWPVVRSDWRYPQFLATPYQIGAKMRENHNGGRISALFDAKPEMKVLLSEKPDPGFRKNFAFWNRHQTIGKNRFVFNSIAAIKNAGFSDFWFESRLLEDLKGDWRVQIMPFEYETIKVDSFSADSIVPIDPIIQAKLNPDFLKE